MVGIFFVIFWIVWGLVPGFVSLVLGIVSWALGAWICPWGAWTCVLGVWICLLGGAPVPVPDTGPRFKDLGIPI